MKYIETIEIKNFKSIRHQVIEGCKKINVFIGYPNVGKSNILEALGLFSFLKHGQDERFELKDICRVKYFPELFFNQDSKKDIQIKLNKGLSVEIFLRSSSSIDFSFARLVDFSGNIDHNGLLKFALDNN